MSETTKGEFIEKIVFATVPILFSCIVYLVSDLNTAKTKLTELDNKISIVVSPENTPRPNQSAELARENLRLDFVNEQNESLIRHTQNNGQINLLTWRVTELEKLNGKK
jgi:hypothetical protein